jgi:hypothetical protein
MCTTPMTLAQKSNCHLTFGIIFEESLLHVKRLGMSYTDCMKRILLIVGIVVIVAVAAWYVFFRPAPENAGNYSAYGKQCETVQFLCIEGTERFDDAIGCGCRPIPAQ